VALVDTVSDWVQVGLNAGAILVGGAVWKLYVENLKTTIGTKESETSLANSRVDYWKEKAEELEKRSPEVVEKVLAERIAIRETEIARLDTDRANSSRELARANQELDLLNRTLDQTKGFREILAMEQPDPDDPEYEEFLEYAQEHADRVVNVEVQYLGTVGVDSGQLLLTDPCYIDGEWEDEPFVTNRIYEDSETGTIIRWNVDFIRYDEPLAPYDQTPEKLIANGRLVKIPMPVPDKFPYSYNGACQATLSAGFGELTYSSGHAGAGVAFATGWGDGFYNVFGEKHDGRIVRVYVNLGADPAPPLVPPSTSEVSTLVAQRGEDGASSHRGSA
jgi:hypothetical protein